MAQGHGGKRNNSGRKQKRKVDEVDETIIEKASVPSTPRLSSRPPPLNIPSPVLAETVNDEEDLAYINQPAAQDEVPDTDGVIKGYIGKLVSEASDKKSELYKRLSSGEMWIIPPLPETNTKVLCDDYYLPRVYFFVPWLQFNYLEPRCKCSTIFTKKGWSSNPSARRVVDKNDCYYIVTYRYYCLGCKINVYANTPSFFCQLPDFIQESFPAIYTLSRSRRQAAVNQYGFVA